MRVDDGGKLNVRIFISSFRNRLCKICFHVFSFGSSGFDYRPFVLNWCMSVKIIDGYVVSPIESLKAEWLFSQGRGRSFRVGDQAVLAQYLAQSCPLSGEALENENERKLRLILSKAQQHQRQLQEQIVSGSPATTPNSSSTNNSPSSNRRKGPSRIQSPRVSRLSGHRPATADAIMSNSFHGTSMNSSHTESHNHSNQSLEMTKSLIENFTSDSLMTQSLDPTILVAPNIMSTSMTSSIYEPHPSANGNFYNDQSSLPIVISSSPLITNSKMMPVPESLMSPDCAPPIIQQRPISTLASSTSGYLPSNMKNRANSQPQRPSSVPTPQNRGTRMLKKPEKSSPSNSPRKSMVNTTNAKIHQNQSILKQTTHQQLSVHNEPGVGMSSAATTEDEEEDEVHHAKIKSARKSARKNHKQNQNNHSKSFENTDVERSAIVIQKLWRGYSTRKRTVRDIAESLQQKRTQDYIVKLTKDMEMTKNALENERKIQQLQM